jgi:hypothetical protein
MTITPQQLKDAEERWVKLRDAAEPEKDPAAIADAEAEFQRLARQQTDQLQRAAHQKLISQLLT